MQSHWITAVHWESDKRSSLFTFIGAKCNSYTKYSHLFKLNYTVLVTLFVTFSASSSCSMSHNMYRIHPLSLLITVSFFSCNYSSTSHTLTSNHTDPLSMTTPAITTYTTSFTTLTSSRKSYNEDTFASMTLLGIEIDFCLEASIISEACALLQIIECIIFFMYRHEDGIQSRRPIFTFSFCAISLIYLIFIIPGICSSYTIDINWLPFRIPFFAWYLLRCVCIFLWFWILICKYWFLYFDYNYIILLRLQAMSAAAHNGDHPIHKKRSLFYSSPTGGTLMKSEWFAKHKSDFGNPKRASLCIAIYFLLCFLVLLSLAILEHFFEDIHAIYVIHYYHSLHAYFSNISISEFVFIAMCYIPFITALVFTCRIWSFTESWKIKHEIFIIFLVCAVIFLVDTVLTGFTYFDESTRFALKFMCEALILLWTTLISTVFVTCYIVSKRNKSQKRAQGRKTPRNSIFFENHESDVMHKKKDTQSQGHMRRKSTGWSAVFDEDFEIPLAFILANQLGYSAFLQHCSDELNLENLLFLAHVCHFKHTFLGRVKDRQSRQNAQRKETVVSPQLTSKNIEDQALDSEPFIELQSIPSPSISDAGHKKRPLTMRTIRSDVAVYESDRTHERELVNDESEDEFEFDDDLTEYPDVVEWNAANSLVILTFRMSHNFEREIAPHMSMSDDDTEASLYTIASSLYTMFIRENSEYEINLPSKLRTTLHFFFHQNFADLEANDQQIYEYRLFHIFDKSWAEIWKLITLNSYRRFLTTSHYMSIHSQLQTAYSDELPALYRLILTHVHNDQHVDNVIESHTQSKHKTMKNQKVNGRIRSLNAEEIHDLRPTALVLNISVEPMPVDEQVHHFGRNMVKVKKANV
eukprot:209545_1